MLEKEDYCDCLSWQENYTRTIVLEDGYNLLIFKNETISFIKKMTYRSPFSLGVMRNDIYNIISCN